MTITFEVQRDGHPIYTRDIVVPDPALYSSLVKQAIDAFRTAHPDVSLMDDDVGVVISAG